MSVAKDSFHQALMILTSHENAKVRLTRAWVDGLEKLAADDLPDSIREQFDRMRERLTSRRPVNGEHPIVATIRKMSAKEVSRVGHEIVRMYADVVSAGEPVQLRIVDASLEQEEPLPENGHLPDFLSRH